MRRMEDDLAALSRALSDLEPVEIWLGQRLIINGADQQLLNLRDAKVRVTAMRAKVLADLEQATSEARSGFTSEM